MTDAERWADAHGFKNATVFENAGGEHLSAALDHAEGVSHEGVWPRDGRFTVEAVWR
jgi:hypothetical protein